MGGHFTRDLEGILVISLEQAVAAPLASTRLADAGARVIKVERPGGDFARRYDGLVNGQSAYFVWLNRGKESICLDLSIADDRELMKRLVCGADVFIQNLKPGVAAKFGLDPKLLRKENPRLVTCDISGFGSNGPCAGIKAYDLIVQAEVGLCAITGTGDQPARSGISVCDIAAGITAHGAILQALFARERSGQGRTIEVSLFDSIADWMNVPLLQFLYGKHTVTRGGVSHPTIAPYGAFFCGSGEKIIFSVQNEREWKTFAEKVLERPDYASDERFRTNVLRIENRPLLDRIIGEHFLALSAAEVSRRLQAADIAHGRLNDIEEAAAHPHLRFVEIETPEGSVRVVAPAALSSADEPVARAVPRLGEHGEAIRAEFVTREGRDGGASARR